jgi:hypothetical protein
MASPGLLHVFWKAFRVGQLPPEVVPATIRLPSVPDAAGSAVVIAIATRKIGIQWAGMSES